MKKGIPNRSELLETVYTFSRPSESDRASDNLERIHISEVRVVASYSWADTSVPTIVVPGTPRVWTNHPARKVKPDSGKTYIDKNAARMSSLNRSPLMPIFTAAEALGSLNDLKGHDIVTDRNGLRKLYHWARGNGGGSPFRIDVQLAGSTCLFTRREPKNVTRIQPGGGSKEYGFAYETAATISSESSSGHHRIISYKLADIGLLVRCEIDACLGTGNTAKATKPGNSKRSFSTVAQSPHPAFQVVPKGSGLHNTMKPTKFSAGLNVRLSTSQGFVPQDQLIEIKTYRTKIEWYKVYTQLALGQTPLIYTAQHTGENFAVPEKYNVSDPDNATMVKHARWFEDGLVMLHDILKQILSAVRERGDGAVLSLVQEGGQLKLVERQPLKNKVVEEAVLRLFRDRI
ncbi:geranylgeranyl pyrophosphate synthetase [Moniliophthora roreri]|nr:geranylgeranyl pyrophosphate synthetase [Moniliophthora roreri]